MSKKEIKETQQLLDLYHDYKYIKNSQFYVSNKKFFASVLLKLNSSFNSEEYKEFNAKLNNALAKHQDLLFDLFVITFNLNLKYSQKLLIPMLTKNQSSNNYAEVFTTDLKPKTETEVDFYNLEQSESDSTTEITLNSDLLPQSHNQKYIDLVNMINQQLLELLQKGYAVELIPNTLIFVSKQSQTLKIFFDKVWATEI
ncbi:uncharacterized protein DUF2714 [Mycoplasmopsis mustelae]|uniref:Uncharacterized protein DUF2714 n=1 Tax=Mycoplasmopsis mustelae TaxID=171289 RepID=A0A4R7UD91_9BACT|nr:DUF2714 domain-containing protein [Mycoplasmopsis mustelae]TDV22869.1 uncharacterized protein DUF2714 [Mycoplasmopsis mustelae]